MSDQPKPRKQDAAMPATGEWTVEWLEIAHRDYGGFKAIAEAHNAALAAVRKANGQDRDKWMRDIAKGAKLQQQLAAERRARHFAEHDLIAKFDEQLAAERENLIIVSRTIGELRQQLAAAERERVKAVK